MAEIKHIDVYKRELKETQKRYASISKIRNKLKDDIFSLAKIIDELENSIKPIKPIGINYYNRDKDLCFDFIALNKKCTSKQLVTFLNNELKDRHVRWPILDSSSFMAVMGKFLKEDNRISYEKTPKGHIWSLK